MEADFVIPVLSGNVKKCAYSAKTDASSIESPLSTLTGAKSFSPSKM
jgi:hypothetical protein